MTHLSFKLFRANTIINNFINPLLFSHFSRSLLTKNKNILLFLRNSHHMFYHIVQ